MYHDCGPFCTTGTCPEGKMCCGKPYSKLSEPTLILNDRFKYIRGCTMIIIVEGPDGAGKTTIIKQLMESHPGSFYRHFSNPKTEEEADNYWKVYAEAVSLADPS